MLSGVDNFRELGGLPTTDGRQVRHGALFRAGHLARATDDDVAHLGSLGVTLIVDFRTDHDIEAEGHDRLPPDVRHVRTPVFDEGGHRTPIRELFMSGADLSEVLGGGRARQLVLDGYRRNAVAPWCVEAFSTFVGEVVAADGGAVLWHCSAGKDRAGWAACILGLALGVERDAIVDNYLESNVHRRVDETLARYAESGVDTSLLRPFLEVHADYLQSSFDAAEEQWGSLDAYLRDGLGLTDPARRQLQDHYLS